MANDFFGLRKIVAGSGLRQLIEHVMLYRTFSCMATSTLLNEWQINWHGSTRLLKTDKRCICRAQR